MPCFLCFTKSRKNAARTCKKLPVASFCASETAETGRIANGREQGDHVSRRRGGDRLPQATQKGGIAAERCRRWRRKSTRSVPSRQGHRRRRKKVAARRRKKPRSGKGFNWASANLLFRCVDSRFAEPRIFFWKGFNFVCAKPPLRRAESRFAKPRFSL